MIDYDVFETPRPKVNGEMGETVRYHARTVKNATLSFRKLKKHLQSASTATEGDVTLVVEGIISAIKSNLLEGSNVRIDGLGTFSLGIKSINTDNRRAINATNIRVDSIHFAPAKDLINDIRSEARFRKASLNVQSVKCSSSEIDDILTVHFKDHAYITRRDFQVLCGFTRSTALNRLQRLCNGEHPSLRREGPKNSSIYFPVEGAYQSK